MPETVMHKASLADRKTRATGKLRHSSQQAAPTIRCGSEAMWEHLAHRIIEQSPCDFKPQSFEIVY